MKEVCNICGGETIYFEVSGAISQSISHRRGCKFHPNFYIDLMNLIDDAYVSGVYTRRELIEKEEYILAQRSYP